MKISYDYEEFICEIEMALANKDIHFDTPVAVERGDAMYGYEPIVAIHYWADELDDEVMTVEELLDEMRDVNRII